MKYIHVLDEFSLAGGGVRSVVADVSQEMAKNKLDVYILPLGIPDEDDVRIYSEWAKEKKIHFELLRERHKSLFSAAKKLRKFLKDKINEDKCCLYLHLKRGVIVGLIASRGMKNVRRVEVFHSNYINYQLQERVCKHFLDHHLAVSKESCQQLIDQYGVNPKKVTLAYNGLDMATVRGKIKNIKKSESIYRILSVGRMSPQKNLETSIQAYSAFKRENETFKSEYLIAGDGPQRREFEALAEGNVIFLGMIDRGDVLSNISAADVVLFPSLWEGHSIALLEVLAVGCPVIVTDIPAFREVLDSKPLADDELFRNEPFGAVFHKGNIESCKAAIDYMTHHKEQQIAMKEFVSSLAENYTLQRQAQIYIDVAKF